MTREVGAASRTPAWLLAWFGLDAVVSLAPPIYWAMDGNTAPILGLPAVVVYFLAVSSCTAASVLAAYWVDVRNGEIDA
jgi:hypothetical protein